MAVRDTGATNAGTFASDSTVGTIPWTNPSNAASSNDVWATAAISGTTDYIVDDNSIRIFNGSAYVGNDKASATDWPFTTDGTRTYGSSTDLWGLTGASALKASTINASTFGVGISCQRDASTPESYYEKCTNFGFVLPSSARPVGYVLTVECHYDNGLGGASFVEGTLITTPTGFVRNDLIRLGDLVVAFDKRGNFTSQRVIGIKRGIRRVFRLVAGGIEAFPTTTEKFLVGNNIFKQLSELRVGDTIYRQGIGLLVPAVIEHISKVGNENVISFEIENDHTYLAGGFAVHNMPIISGSTTAYIDHVQFRIYFVTPKDIMGTIGHMIPISR